MNGRYYYATLATDEHGNQICNGLIDTFAVILRDDYVLIESYDVSLIGKMWTVSEWTDNPNPPVTE